jgi:hypothetical protein
MNETAHIRRPSMQEGWPPDNSGIACVAGIGNSRLAA